MLDWFKKQKLRSGLLSGLYWAILLLGLEILLQLVAFDTLGGRFWVIAGFSIFISCLICLALSFLPEKIRFWF